MMELLKVEDLHVHFGTPAGLVQANRGVNLSIGEYESVGIMGESGCGKTVLFLSLLRLQMPGKIVKGSVVLGGRDLTGVTGREMQRIRGSEVGLIPQDHSTALNPSFTVGDQLRETLAIREYGGGLWKTTWGRRRMSESSVRSEMDALLKPLGLGQTAHAEKLLDRYPHQLSGGIRQRVLIAMALLAQPRLVIADEPTTALDRATQMQTLDLLRSLSGRTTMLIISHDANVLAYTCERVAIMYGGRIVEQGATAEVFKNPRHPYTRLLISCQRVKRGVSLPQVTGDVLDLIHFPPGCSYHPSCPYAMPLCSEVDPPEHEAAGVTVACHLFGDGGSL